jgi:transposase-like protein
MLDTGTGIRKTASVVGVGVSVVQRVAKTSGQGVRDLGA